MPTSHPQLNSTICSHCSLRNHNLKLGFLYASLFGGSLSKALRYKPNPCKREIGSQGGLSHSGHSLPFTTVAETRGSADTDNKNIQKWGNKNLLDNFTLKEFVSTFLPTEGKCNVTGASGTQQGGPSSTLCDKPGVTGEQVWLNRDFSSRLRKTGFISLSIYTSWGHGF